MSTGISEELQKEFGRLSMGFSRFETAVGCAVGFLANPKDFRIGHILVAELSFRARVAAFSALYPERLPGEIDEKALRSFLSEAHLLEDERNKLIHSFYWPGSVGDPRAIRIKTTAKERNGLRIQFEDVTLDFIASQADKAWDQLPRCLDELMRRIEGYTTYVGKFYGVFLGFQGNL